MRAVDMLHQRLDDALWHLGGRSRGRGSREREEELDPESQIEIEEAVQDLASALLGREVVFTSAQPYPSNDDGPIEAYWDKLRGGNLERFPAPLPKGCRCTRHALMRTLLCPVHKVTCRD